MTADNDDDEECNEVVSVVEQRTEETDSAFSVEPVTGVLPGGVTAQFMVTFAPPSVSYTTSDGE